MKYKFYYILTLIFFIILLVCYAIFFTPECKTCNIKEHFKFQYDLNYCDIGMKECMNDGNTLEDCFTIVGDECRNIYPD